MTREADLEARLISVIRVHDDLLKANKVLQTQIAGTALEHSKVHKKLTNAIIQQAETNILKKRIDDLERENRILRDLLGLKPPADLP